jgi:hypothetical protein
MKRDEATKLAETALGQLAEALEQGHSKALIQRAATTILSALDAQG